VPNSGFAAPVEIVAVPGGADRRSFSSRNPQGSVIGVVFECAVANGGLVIPIHSQRCLSPPSISFRQNCEAALLVAASGIPDGIGSAGFMAPSETRAFRMTV